MKIKHNHTSTEASGVVTGTGSGKTGLSKKTVLIAGVLVVVFALIGWVVATKPFTQSNKKYAVCTGNSAKPIMSDASKAISEGKIQQLGPVVSKVQSLKNYDKDPNCLNIIVSYYIGISDSKNARLYLDKLNKVYDENVGFSKTLGPKAYDIAALRQITEFLEKASENLSKNIQQYSQPE